MSKLFYVFETRMGWVGIAGREGSVSDLRLPKPTRSEAVLAISEGTSERPVESKDDFLGIANDIGDYFSGRRVEIRCGVDLSEYTEFQRTVWSKAREIPYGETRSYGWIADKIGCASGSRAVGQAMAANPVPVIVPCHRVVRSDGGLGGFSCGLRWKVRLLELERNGKGME